MKRNSGGAARRSSRAQRIYIHGDFHLMRAAAGENAAERTHVTEVAPIRDGDVILAGHLIVRGIKIHPAHARTKKREPRVRRVRADELLLSRWRERAQVATHVARGKAE